MPLERTATIVGAGVTLVAWLAGTSPSDRRTAAETPSTKAPVIDTRGAELDREIAHLAERMRPVAVAREPGRNLFAFVARQPRVTAPAPRAALSEAAPVRPAPPALKLAGIAEDRGGSADVVRTAIINARGQLFLAKEGDAVTDRYRVARISADVVELTDVEDGTVLRLALK